MKRHVLKVWCDGACSPNPGIGGWGAVMEFNGQRREFSGAEENTTNNRMEIMSAIRVLEAIKVPCDIHLTSDSQYLVRTINENWKKEKNSDLWTRLQKSLDFHSVTFEWVRGHDSNSGNTRADELAVEARVRFKAEQDNQKKIEERYRKPTLITRSDGGSLINNGNTVREHTKKITRKPQQFTNYRHNNRNDRIRAVAR